ncbi:MAG: NAD(P)H-dependent oxidoreductase [Gammaproteobacteria bacterium]|jgi:FMN-dependent NADH-azoreductase|nr:NAD(P)H-dependent oxidoreductase [Gammaproteobacteria bacterium]MDH3982988.1 NAD(P)H-dependent oxidoreductase [Gammaproteobacteria bacterium]
MAYKPAIKILEINTAARYEGSVSRDLVADLVNALEDRFGSADIKRRDLAKGLPFIDEEWVTANTTPEEERSEHHRRTLAHSDELVAELQDADVLVIGAPIYNFSVPAVLKAWIDMVARARLTFRYTETGPEGLLTGKKAYVIVPSGGVPVGSEVDFATPYLRHALAFIGITDVEFVGAQGADRDDGQALDNARAYIAELVHLASKAA